MAGACTDDEVPAILRAAQSRLSDLASAGAAQSVPTSHGIAVEAIEDRLAAEVGRNAARVRKNASLPLSGMRVRPKGRRGSLSPVPSWELRCALELCSCA